VQTVTGERLPPVPVEDFTDAHKAAIIGGLGPGTEDAFLPWGAGKWPVPNSMAAMLHHVPLGAHWLAFGKSVIYDSTLGNRLRELMVLRVAWRTRSEYEWLHHVRLAPEKNDIAYDEIVAISEDDYSGFESLERDLLTATDELMDTYRISDATWARLADVLSPAQLQEIPFAVGAYTVLAMAFNSFGTQVEPVWSDVTAPALPQQPKPRSSDDRDI
jgi:alkylhydroperoxidase family enzyme